MDDPMQANLVKDLKNRMAQKANEAARFPINIGFGLGSPSPVATDSSSSPRYFTPDSGPSGNADSLDSLGRPPSGSPSSPPTFSFSNPLYADSPTYPPSHEIQEESYLADFRSAEVHHWEPLTRPLRPPRQEQNPPCDPIDVDPIGITVIDPGGSFVYRQASSPKRPLMTRFVGVARHLWPASALAQVPCITSNSQTWSVISKINTQET